MPTIPFHAALKEAAAALQAAGIENPRREGRLLLAHLLGLDPNSLPAADTPIDTQALLGLVSRRSAHEPLAYITGRRGFWTFEVEVSRATLIPRPDSETLIEAAIAARPERARTTSVLDLGTGTGCLLLAALLEFPSAFGIGTDRVPEAASLAARNAARLVPGRAAFAVTDWAEAIVARFDLILCNPPYIPSEHIAGLMPDVAHHEPASALDGGRAGLTEYERLLPTLSGLLKPGGTAIFELGAGQSEATMQLAFLAGFTRVTTKPDLAGIPRALVLHAAA